MISGSDLLTLTLLDRNLLLLGNVLQLIKVFFLKWFYHLQIQITTQKSNQTQLWLVTPPLPDNLHETIPD